MKTTEISTSPSPPCRLLNLALTAAQFPPPRPYAQVRTHHATAPTAYPGCSLRILCMISSLYLLRKWGVLGAWLCAQQPVPGGLPVPYFPASIST